LIASRRGALRRVLLLTDGKPHDVDVHDPHYLVEDARQAVREAARRGVLMQCVSLDAAALKPLQRVFGPSRVHKLKTMAAALKP
jgi:nitric oxide reductase NorD protein